MIPGLWLMLDSSALQGQFNTLYHCCPYLCFLVSSKLKVCLTICWIVVLNSNMLQGRFNSYILSYICIPVSLFSLSLNPKGLSKSVRYAIPVLNSNMLQGRFNNLCRCLYNYFLVFSITESESLSGKMCWPVQQSLDYMHYQDANSGIETVFYASLLFAITHQFLQPPECFPTEACAGTEYICSYYSLQEADVKNVKRRTAITEFI